jgi:hypothetical protein
MSPIVDAVAARLRSPRGEALGTGVAPKEVHAIVRTGGRLSGNDMHAALRHTPCDAASHDISIQCG